MLNGFQSIFDRALHPIPVVPERLLLGPLRNKLEFFAVQYRAEADRSCCSGFWHSLLCVEPYLRIKDNPVLRR